eukprot:1997705-Pyramimonas_sp.AAC.1
MSAPAAQVPETTLAAWADTDYAGCKRTRNTTSEEVVLRGKRTIETWHRAGGGDPAPHWSVV